MSVYLACFLASFLVSLLLMMTKNWHGRLSMDHAVGVQKFHSKPTPRIGGLGVFAGLLLAYHQAPQPLAQILGPMLLAGMPAFAFGLLEDVTKRVGVLARLLATMVSGVTAWYLTGVAMQNTGVPALDAMLQITALAVLFTAFTVGGVANSVNIIDGFHGLASGTVAIMLGAMGLIALQVGDAPLASVSFVVAAAALGFAAVNWPLGKIFLGDGGAYLLGFLVAWVAILLPMRNPQLTAWTTLLACAYPVIEVLYSVWRRWRQKASAGAPDNLHLHSLVKTQIVMKHVSHWNPRLRNAAVAPLVWPYAALPAALAMAWPDAPVWVHLAELIGCVFVYHVFYQRLARQALMAPAGDIAPVALSPQNDGS